jgi:tetratricopeptide (TPR) repeat protein
MHDLHTDRYALAFFEADAAEMHRQVEWTAGRPGDEDLMLSFRSETEAYFGRFVQARDLTRKAAAVAERNNQREAASMYLLNAALREAEIGNESGTRQLTATAFGLASSPELQILGAVAAARSGDARRASALADDLARQLPRSTMLYGYWLPTIRASLALGRNDAAGAVELLRGATGYELGVADPDSHMGATLYPLYIRGLALLRAGRAREATAEFQKILDHRGIVLNFVTGALAHLQLGRAKAISGDLQGARKAYDDFFTLWKDADPDVPILKAARTEFARLH